MNKVQEYQMSFIFGVKVILLVIMLFVPIAVGSLIGLGTYKIINTVPYLSVDELAITSIFWYDDESKIDKELLANHLSKGTVIRFNSTPKYLVINRILDDDDKKEKVVNRANEILLNQKDGDRMIAPVDHNGITGENQVTNLNLLKSSSYYGVIIDEGLTSSGMTIFGLVILFLFIICIASYFPIVKAFINLFKFKRLF